MTIDSRSLPEPGWTIRYLRASSFVIFTLAVVAWLRPVNVRTANLVPFGCGSVASPQGGELASYFCSADMAGWRRVVVALFLSSLILALLAALGGRLIRLSPWARGLAIAAPPGLGLMAWSIARLFTVVADTDADGTLIRCGTPLRPALDSISTGLCAQWADEARVEALGALVLGIGLLLAGAYIAHQPQQGLPDEAPSELSGPAESVQPRPSQDVRRSDKSRRRGG